MGLYILKTNEALKPNNRWLSLCNHYDDNMVQEIQEEITSVECDIVGERILLTCSKVLGEIANWVPDTRHTIGHYSQNMYTNDIYFYLNVLLVSILLNWNDAKEEIFLMFDEF